MLEKFQDHPTSPARLVKDKESIMTEKNPRKVNHRIEQNPYDDKGITFVFLDENNTEIGRENFSLYILIMTGLRDLVINQPENIEVEIKEEINGRITGVSIQKK